VDVAQEMTRYARYQILTNSGSLLLAKSNSLPSAALRVLLDNLRRN
jgi:flagellin-like hook-associated protein FlgL